MLIQHKSERFTSICSWYGIAGNNVYKQIYHIFCKMFKFFYWLSVLSTFLSSSEALTNFIACSRESGFDLDATFFNLNFLLSYFVFIIKMNQSNCFSFIWVYFQTSSSKNHVKKVTRALEVIIWIFGVINDPLCYERVIVCISNIFRV